MRYDPERHHRRSVRLREHDYAAGGTYFVTICTVDRACVFGEVVGDAMRTNAVGRIVEAAWVRTGVIRPEVEIDVFALMPNHLHGLVTILPQEPAATVGAVGAMGGRGIPERGRRSLASIVAQFKASSTAAVNACRGTPGARLWQRGFYEHVVRDDRSFEAIAGYIVTNPERWQTDEYRPGVDEP